MRHLYAALLEAKVPRPVAKAAVDEVFGSARLDGIQAGVTRLIWLLRLSLGLTLLGFIAVLSVLATIPAG